MRCSTAEQAVEGFSLSTQTGKIEAWCEATGAELVQIVEDAGVSGTKKLAERPGGSVVAALLAARTTNVDTVVVARLDRLGRDAADTLSFLRQFASGSVGLVSIADHLDLASPQGKAMAQMSAVFGELERNLGALRTSDALCELRSRGKAYGPVPYGLSREGDDLVPHVQEQLALARMRRLRGRGKSYQAIADSLNRVGIPAKRGGLWAASSTRSVLMTAEKARRVDAEVAA